MKPELQARLWRWILLALLLLPLFPALGTIGICVIMLVTCIQAYDSLLENRYYWGWGLLTGLMVLSAIFAYQPLEAWLGLANFIPFFLWLLVLGLVVKTTTQLRELAYIIVLPSILVVILGLGQMWGGWNSPELVKTILGWELIGNGNPEGRLSSLFMYANIAAGYLMITFILSLGLLVDSWQNWLNNDNIKTRSYLAGFSFIVLINALGLILTSSRNAWAIALGASLIFAVYLGWYWILAIFSGLIAMILGAAYGSNPWRAPLRQIIPAYFWARISDEMYQNRPLDQLRTTQWRFVAHLIPQRPWLGWGLRNFTPLYQLEWGVWLGHPHNLYLMLMAEIGIPATILFSSLVGYILAKGGITLQKWSHREQKRERLLLFSYLIAFIGCIVFNCFDVTIFDLRLNIFAWSLLGAIAGIADINWKT